MKYYCIFFLLISSLGLCAQSHLVLKGDVTENGPEFPLARATVTLQQGKQSTFASTNDKGAFVFSGLKNGNFLLITTFVGFASDTLRLTMKKDTIVHVILKGQGRELTEVVIKTSIPPASAHRDTISYNAQVYPSRPDATVEELLRKLPGIDIDQDGNVTMQGQKVDKILIDGKTFFIDDLRKATRNLPADIVAQVEVYDSQSDADKRAGIVTPGNTKTINLKIKNKDKEGLVGKVYAGEGNDGSYATGGNITGIGIRLFSAEVKTNNIGDQFTGTENNGSAAGNGKSKSSTISLDYKQDLSKKLTVDAYAGYSSGQNSMQGSTSTQTFLADSSLIQKAQHTAYSKSAHYNLGLYAEYKPSDSTYLNYNVSLSPDHTTQNTSDTTQLQNLKGNNLTTASSGSSRNNTYSTGNNFSQSLAYTHRFKKARRAIELSFSQSLAATNQQQDLYTLVAIPGAAMDSIVNQRAASPVATSSYRVHVLYAEPFTSKLNLHLTANVQIRDNRSDRTAFDYDPASGAYDLPDSLTSNQFNDRTTTSQLRLSLTGLPRQKIYYQFGLGGQSSTQNNDNLSTGRQVSRTFNSLLPAALLRYNISKGQHLDIRYNGQSQDPTIDQLQPVPDLSNPYLIKTGNPELQQAFNQNLAISFLDFNAENFRNLQIEINGDMTSHPISSSTRTLPGGVQQVEFVNTGTSYEAEARADFGFPLIDNKHGTGSLGGGLTTSQNQTIINGQAGTATTSGATASLRINYHSGNTLFVESNATLHLLNNIYSADPAAASKMVQQDYSADGYVSLPLALLAGGHYNLEVRGAGALPAQQSSLLNAYIAKDLDAGHKAQLRLSGFNLLNSASALNQATGPNFITTTSSTTEHRLLLLSFVYNFKYFNSGG